MVRKLNEFNERLEAFLFKIYLKLKTVPFIKNYLSNLKNIFEIVNPTDEHTIAISSMKLMLKANIASIFLFFICINFKGTTVYNIMIITSLIYVFNLQIIYENLEKQEYKLLKQLEKYLGEVRHHFHNKGIVEEAIYDSLENADYEISLHMDKIYNLLIEDDFYETGKYKEMSPNKFFMTFLALCQATITYGDTICEKKSLFLDNLNSLRNEVSVEILKREKIKYVFAGLIFITILPVFFLKAIENWGISNLPELEKYYYGTYGVIVTTIIFIVTIVVYNLVNKLKENSKLYRKQHLILEFISNIKVVKTGLNYFINHKAAKVYCIDSILKRISEGITVRQFLVQKVTIFLGSMLFMTWIIINMVYISKNNEINYTRDYESTSIIANKYEADHYQNIIKNYTNSYKNKKIYIDKKNDTDMINVSAKKNKYHDKEDLHFTIKRDIINISGVKEEYIGSLLADEVIERMIRYQNYSYHWYYILFTILISYFISSIPYFILLCKKQLLHMNMEDEVMQFQCIIMMLMYIKRMNVETILEWLENFSEIFKPSIVECVDNYSYDEGAALSKMKEDEPFLPFVRIIENLEACDKLGIEKSFDEIATQRSFFTQKRKQDNEIMITNKGVIGKILAYIPLTLTLILYLIVPFILESFIKLMGYLTQLKSV